MKNGLSQSALASIARCCLPNIAMLSDRQCEQIRDYVHAGGSIMASFETSLYDEDLNPRPDFGLADLLGIGKAGDVDRHKRQCILRSHRAPAPYS